MGLPARERAIRQRLKDDFEHYAAKCLKIATKEGKIEALALNAAQRHIHREIERQVRETGRARALILKGRLQGASTYAEGRFYWRVTHRTGVRVCILTHLDVATRRLFEMAKRFHEHCPLPVRPSVKISNARELWFDRLDSGFRVATAGSEGVGRSETFQYFHGSEVAYWPHAEDHVAGALQAVPNAPGTEVILESTSAGRTGMFWQMCEAARRGEGEYRLIFVPWFWQSEYRAPVPADFRLSSEEERCQAEHELDLGQIAWRRGKLVELGGAHKFRREYPATVDEAFLAGREGALWAVALIGTMRVHAHPPLKRIVVGVDPSGGDGPANDEVGIVVAGIAHDGHAYVLEDLSGRMGPDAWGRKVAAAYQRHQADRIVAEANYGGQMVEHVIRTVNANLPVRLVTASRGKTARAEPIAALYEQGRVHHLGTHVALEDEMTTWVPGESKGSPNRLDALVWTLTELMVGQGDTGLLDYYRTLHEEQKSAQAKR